MEAETPTSDEFIRGLLEARRMYAQVWANVTRREIHEVDFTTNRFSDELRSRWFERRTLFDGTAPAVGQRVLTVRETAERWHMPHAHDGHVHEITSLLGGDTHLVECGPTQMGVALLAQAPAGSEVTCPSCRGWHAFREKSRIDAESYRKEQFRRRTANELIKRLASELANASPLIAPDEIRELLTEASSFVEETP
jgi:hypothetical protein